MDNSLILSKDDIRILKRARNYLLRETNPSFKEHTRNSNLFVEKAKEYGVGVQHLHDHIANLN